MVRSRHRLDDLVPAEEEPACACPQPCGEMAVDQHSVDRRGEPVDILRLYEQRRFPSRNQVGFCGPRVVTTAAPLTSAASRLV